MFCYNCGAHIDEDEVFCSKCGTELIKIPRSATSDATEQQYKSELDRSARRGSFLGIMIIPLLILIVRIPSVGMFGFLIWSVLMIIHFVSHHGKVKAYKSYSQAKNKHANTNVASNYHTQNKTASSEAINNVSEALQENPGAKFVAKAATSYVLGKAAISAMDEMGIGIPKRNPYSDKYRDTWKNADRRSISQNVVNKRVRVSSADGKRSLFITTMPNGSQYLSDTGNRRVGHYDAIRNETTDGNGRLLGKGNLLHTLK